MSTGNPWETGVTPEDAWQNLASQPPQPSESGFVAGAIAQLRQEVHIPTSTEVGASLVHSVASGLRAGEDQWQKIEPPATMTVEKKSVIPEVVKGLGSFLGTLVAAAAGAATTSIVEKINDKKAIPKQSIVPVYRRPTNKNEVIDVVATDVEE